ncbi:GtrA family protein [Trueperella bialowiezensis]|uniref:GtrA-like protein n=1 Tax=Trueperella bialowiezensis TaxID=312285 RepID=A0A3S4VFF6_9ACTO|nr:GtrA family protein [Trueperella bialowiezensis]VEI12938.1 GtrA-like protein [Trueperella bialowiezensis]
MDRLIERLLRGQTWREWLIEFLQFITVGLGSYVVDVGLFNLLAYSGIVNLPGDAPMVAKTISVAISIVFSWVMNRAWTFRNKSDKSTGREFILFLLVNIGGMLIALGCLWVSRFLLNFDSQLADNIAANGVGLVLGTAFRYVCYRYVVFTK